MYPLFIKRWFPSFDFHTHCLTNRFVCNFLSSSASFNLCSCFFWLTLVFRFHFRLSLGFRFHGLAPLPLLFLTPAVFAPFRSLQFWVLTTQPLCFLSLLFLSPPHSGFLSAPILLSLPRFSPFSPAWFPVHSFPVPVLSFAVCFLSPFLASLPQLFHECLPSFPLSLLFRHFPFRFRFLSSASASLPATQPSVSSFPFFPFLPLSGFLGAASPLSLPCFPRSSPAGFPSVLSRFPYSAFCWFPFVLPCFAPAAVPQVIPF